MSFSTKYLEELEKKKKEQEKENSKKSNGLLYSSTDIAPVLTSADYNSIAPPMSKNTIGGKTKTIENGKLTVRSNVIEEKPDKWYEGWFRGGAFDDGYQFGDVSKTIVSTVSDLGDNIAAGVLGMGEKTVDAGAMLVGSVAGKFGANNFKDSVGEFVAKDLYDEKELAKNLNISSILLGGINKVSTVDRIEGLDYEKNSVFGNRIDSLAQSGGQLLATRGLQSVGVPWYVTSGVMSFGSASESALREGATVDEAATYGLISAAAEILTEKLFGGSGLGEKGFINLEPLTKGLAGKAVKVFADFGIDMAAEGMEEFVSSFFSRLGSALYKEESLWEILGSEEAFGEYLVSFISGAALSGGMNAGKVTTSAKQGTDYRTGLTSNEQKVFDSELEARIKEAEAGGEKLSKNDKAALYDAVRNDLEKGYIAPDTIEKVLNEEGFKAYDELTKESEEFKELYNTKTSELSEAQKDRLAELKAKNQADSYENQLKAARDGISSSVLEMVKSDRLGKGSLLSESYAEQARRGEAFAADVTKYDAKQQKVIQNAIDSGILNNTNRTHEFVDMVAKLSADKGVLFNFTDNAKLKESGFALDGKTVNGYVTKDGITVNMDSAKAINTVVGHEITHVLEGTELYGELQSAVFEYAKSKKDYQGRLDTLAKLYEGVKDADVNRELTADLVGDYLFTDSDFINHLSTKNRNVFQKIYDEVKYLYKLATAGSKEARQLEAVKRAFDKAYKQSGGGQADTKYSISEADAKAYADRRNAAVEKFGTTTDIDRAGFVIPDGRMLNMSRYGQKGTQHRIIEAVFDSVKGDDAINQFIQEGNVRLKASAPGIEIGEGIIPTIKQNSAMRRFINTCLAKSDVFYLDITGKDGSEIASVTYYANQTDANDILYDVEKYYEKGRIPKSQSATFYSLSDSDGKKLSKEQGEYFKDSKMRDDDGNLMVMYHGSRDAGFHTFDPSMSDDGTSLFFVNRNDVAATYSSTTETYEAQSIRTAEDANNFIESIGVEGYEVVEKDGKFTLLYEGDRVADSNTAKGIYEEFCWYEGVGDGDANYKVYLNLTNPLVVDAEGRNWNNVTREYSQEVADRYNSLTAEEKAALYDIAGWGEFDIFRENIRDSALAAEQGTTSAFTEEYTQALASAYEKLGGDSANMYDLYSIASENFSEESIKEFAVAEMNTRDYAAKAKAEGYDGVIFKNIHDNGAYSNGREGASTVAIAFNSEQVKSVANTQPTGDPDIRYSLSEDSEGRQLSPAVQKRFENSKVIDENGSLKVVYHGTAAGEFSIFDKAKGSVEGDFGSGFYFTDNEADVSEHYEGGGPDFEIKVGRRADEIWGEEPELEYEEAERRARDELYKGSHKFEVYLNVENPATVGETILFEQDSYLEQYNEEDYDDYDDYMGDVEQLIADDIDQIIWDIERNVDIYKTDGIANVLWEAVTDGGIGIEELKAKMNDLYLEDNNGNLVANEVTRQIIESLGYDGIIDPTVSGKWNMNIESGTTHYIVFKPNQIKAVTNANPTDNPDIHRSLTKEGDTPRRYGNYNVSGKDLKLDAPVRGEATNAEAVKTEAAKTTDEVTGSETEQIAPVTAEAEPEASTNWRDIADSLTEPELDEDGSYTEKYLTYNNGIAREVSSAAVNEVISDVRSGMSSAELAAKSRAAMEEYERLQASKPSENSYTQAEELKLSTLYKQYSLYNFASRDPEGALKMWDNAPASEQSGADYAPTIDERAELEARAESIDEEIAALEKEAEEKATQAYEGTISSEEFDSFIGEIDQRYKELSEERDSVAERISALENAEAEDQRARLDSLGDSDAPPELEAPYPGEDIAPSDPFENRNMKEVSKDRKAKAYMYENPEVKPYFQAEANYLLGELERTEKPQTIYNGWMKRELSYEAAQDIPEIYRTPRITTEDIKYLRDTVGMSYADIEKGLKAIIEDNGAENIAAAKKLEFVINDRLLNGYNSEGVEVPPNQDYINLINEKQITEYSEEAKRSFFESANARDIAPLPEQTDAAGEIAPVPENLTGGQNVTEKAYEAIRPPRQSQEPRMKRTEPRMKRVDSEDARRGGEKERSWYETSTRSEAVDGIITPDDIPDDVRYYQVKSNKKTLGAANARLAKDGYAKSREYFEGRMTERKLSVEDIALGERLIQEAAKAGDAKAVRDLIIDVSIIGTELGQRVQALSMIRRLTPEGQLKALTRTVERGKAKGDKAFEGVEITQDMIDYILKTYGKDGTFNQSDLNKAVEDVKQRIADQMRVGAMDYINSWRYLSMLGNPKTHLRNVVSNVAMLGTRTVKNAIARTAEGIFLHNKKPTLITDDIAPTIGNTANKGEVKGQQQIFSESQPTRTKTWRKASDVVREFAKQTTKEMESDIKGDTKYSEEGSIKAKRQIFKTKAANAAANANTFALEWEDALFSKSAFRSTLSEYLTANGIKTEADIKNNPRLVEKAKDYALEEAQRATFRQDSYLAKKINEIEKKNPLMGIAVGSVMPFKKTPINIAKTGLAYSPLGFARNIYDAVQVGRGKMDASEAIDHLAQTLTGSSLALIGYALAEAGILNGAGDDDKEGEYDYQLGEQSYSFNFGGDSYSVSWLSPVAMPLFVGANAYEQLVEGKEWNPDVVTEALAQTLDPLSEMSFVSSLDDVLSSYDSGVAKIWGAGESMAQNYITQFVPTLLSQVAQTADDTKRSTRAAADSTFKFGEETANKIKYKIPGLRNTLEPTTDIWGNEVKQSENVLVRGFESFISPANKKNGIITAVDEEIKSLYGETGDAGVMPSIPDNYINYDGNKYKMSAKDYTEYKEAYGETAFELMEKLFNTETYKNADSETRADLVKKVFDYARDEARAGYFTKYGVDYTNATLEGEEYYKENPIVGAIEADMPVDEYVFSKDYPEKYAFFKENGISYETYASADEDGKRAYTWAAENPGKFIMSKAVAGDVVEYRRYTGEMYDIKADKDSSGKSIVGSRKEKVLDYINGLDLDYGAKIILFKSEYKADDTYNYDIIEYLNGRDDISYEDMETILKELGFTVDKYGNIYWD